MAFSYTSVKPKKLSMGNRVAYVYKLKDVATSGSVIHTPFRKITGVLMQTLSPVTSDITFSISERTGPGTRAKVSLTADATSQGYCTIVGLL